MRRAAIALLLLLNFGGGCHRYADFDPFDLGRLWDMNGAARVVADCDPASFHSDTPSPACRSLPPYLPLAFPFFLGISTLDSSTLELGWLLLVGGAFLAVFAKEASAWAGRIAPDSAASARAVYFVVLSSLVAFKGTSLGMLAGQPSLLVALPLYAFAMIETGVHPPTGKSPFTPSRLVAASCLAVAASKPNIALPFFVYLLMRRDFPMLALASAATITIQAGASFLWLGPGGSVSLLLHGAELVASLPANAAVSMGASGRVDLEPLLAVFGLGDPTRHGALAVFGAVGLAGLARLAPRLDPRVLLFGVNSVFVALLYHRDYDLVLLALLAQSFLRDHHGRFGLLACAATLPAVLPLQWIHALGMDTLPQLAFAWNFLGTSMVLGVLGIAVWMLMVDEGAARPTVATLRGSRPEIRTASKERR